MEQGEQKEVQAIKEVQATIPPDVMAQAQSEMERRQRVQRVAQMIQTILEKERCRVSPSLTITPEGTQFGWNIIALP